jgi:putative heme iron utilization protein
MTTWRDAAELAGTSLSAYVRAAIEQRLHEDAEARVAKRQARETVSRPDPVERLDDRIAAISRLVDGLARSR